MKKLKRTEGDGIERVILLLTNFLNLLCREVDIPLKVSKQSRDLRISNELKVTILIFLNGCKICVYYILNKVPRRRFESY